MPKKKKQPAAQEEQLLPEEQCFSNEDGLDWTFTDREEFDRAQAEEPGYIARLLAWRLNGGKK